MPEHRRSPRISSKQPGTALLSDRTVLECSIRDLSATGARLSFRHPTFLPKTFRLRFEDHDQKVTVMWQRGPTAGVRFQSPIRLAMPKKRRLFAWAS